MNYDFAAIESKWRPRWSEWRLDAAPQNPRRKFYILEMFAYPSGDIHMGHFRNYSIGDVVARYRMMRGDDVLHPFGWDAFGQPAEGAAIKHGIAPRTWTIDNIETGKRTLQRMAILYDWDREIRTCEPDYYKWTQWVFLKLYERGLAYSASSMVNWCPACQTVLADEQAQGGICWRCGRSVAKKWLDRCWFFKYAAYADRLLKDIDRLTGWPENVRTMQRNWIGRSEGSEIDFTLEKGEKLPIFTTRPDTIYGVTFMAVSPVASMASTIAKGTSQEKEVADYIQAALQRTEAERAKANKEGVFTGRYAVNPFNGERVQLWVADYVLGGYGTGVVMGVPAHDQRDFEFAKKYGIPIKVVIQPPDEMLDPASMGEAYVEEGKMVDSGPFEGLGNAEGIRRVTEYAESKGFGRFTVHYKLHDWLISRQRYWGCPIPMIHCGRCGAVPVPEKDLPVVLPLAVTNFTPKGRSPLADCPEFVETRCPKCGREAERDTDTMDTFMDSSFYLFRYCDPRNEREPWSLVEAKKWLPVDLYIGGVEHACGHLLYFRFVTKVLYDAGVLPVDEPVVRLFNHGMVCDEKGDIMSKSKGNVVSPADIFGKWGVDVARLAMFFFAPSEDQIKWSQSGLVGAQRFVHRVVDRVEWIVQRTVPGRSSFGMDRLSVPMREVVRKFHQAVQRMTHACAEDLHFNTAIAAVMELMNALEAIEEEPDDPAKGALRTVAEGMVRLLAPLAPFLCEELWEKLGYTTTVFKSGWPAYDPALAQAEHFEIVVQVNGKVRGKLSVDPSAGDDEIKRLALEEASVRKALEGKEPRKVIVVPKKLVNIVV